MLKTRIIPCLDVKDGPRRSLRQCRRNGQNHSFAAVPC
jgi:imidazole glycerol phosphate synthase subunit HisF